jgi:hypothetical protein
MYQYICALFVWLISHQPTVLFSQNKPVITNQPSPTSQQYFSLRTNQHQPSATGRTNRLLLCMISLTIYQTWQLIQTKSLHRYGGTKMPSFKYDDTSV